MNKLMRYSLLFILVAFFGHNVNAENVSAFSIVDGIKYEYYLAIERDPISLCMIAPENQEVIIDRIVSNYPYSALDVVTLPMEAFNEKYGVNVIFKGLSNTCSGSVNVNTLVIPKDFPWYINNSYFKNTIGRIIKARRYVTENETEEGLYSKEGVLFEKREGMNLPDV